MDEISWEIRKMILMIKYLQNTSTIGVGGEKDFDHSET